MQRPRLKRDPFPSVHHFRLGSTHPDFRRVFNAPPLPYVNQLSGIGILRARVVKLLLLLLLSSLCSEREREMLLKHGNSHISTLIREDRQGQSTLPVAIGPEISRTDFRLNICTRSMEGEQDQVYINLVAIDVACPLPLSTETFKRNMSRVSTDDARKGNRKRFNGASRHDSSSPSTCLSLKQTWRFARL